MSSPNELEIISRGSVDVTEHTSHEVPSTIEQQNMTLEKLPSERPRCPSEPAVDEVHEQAELFRLQKQESAIPLSLQTVSEELAELEQQESAIPLSLQRASQELAESRLETESLLKRIGHLSSRIRCGLSLVEKTGATVPTLPAVVTDIDAGGNPDDVMMMSLHSDSRVEESVNCGDESSVLEPEENEGGERGVASPESDSGVDPQLVQALEKMRRLDKRLADLLVREREVKGQRRRLEMKMQAKVDSADCQGPSLPPVFQTQVSEDPAHTVHDTNFIQRNEEAGMTVVLSESERTRLEQLLTQDDDHEEVEGVSVSPQANGFKLSAESQTALRHIDIQLKAMGASEAGDRDSGEEEQDFPPLSPGQRLREIDERLAELRNSSPPSQVMSPSVLQQLQSAHSRELSTGH